MPQEQDNFVTVVSVDLPKDCTGYVTVLTIGDDNLSEKDLVEEVLVYRLPGERLGFGLKFEGGTKASEFVKRLFIQSCAPDSPASRVKSSWGKLVEGDEVLEIDNIPVKTMTRIDCVRCLKDSNVVIKLLIRHFQDQKQEAPLVISAEKKRTPPPPPPVPPRKIPRKLIKKDVLPSESNGQERQQDKLKKSPRSTPRSIKASYSPDVPRRRSSEGSPPDAQVYVDLFSQESTQSLSESDDTGSTISTVIDRFGSFPTTTTSSFAGSLPSTPTSIQKHLDLSNIMNYDEEEAVQVSRSVAPKEDDKVIIQNVNDEGGPLQPPSCFQDAPLSYGNESVRMDDLQGKKEEIVPVMKKPPVPPRSKENINKGFHDENMNISNLPRLVDFLPKSKEFVECSTEMQFFDGDNGGDETDNVDVYGIDLYSSKWGLSTQLATIGEVEEPGQDNQCNRTSSTPVVIIENADFPNTSCPTDSNTATPPSDHRQPPDGDEFPDYTEPSSKYRDTTNDSLLKTNSMSSNDLTDFMPKELAYLHTRSLSLIDISSLSKNEKLTNLMEQRRKGLSKLKGLVIPEIPSEDSTPSVDLPEINIQNPPKESLPTTKPLLKPLFKPSSDPLEIKPLTAPPWSSNSSTTIPKYSPAFKRRSLQVYPIVETKSEPKTIKLEDLRLDLSDPPKSLESITSPTRSDCSFEYVPRKAKLEPPKEVRQPACKIEDESDNDSAVSSSQSSFASRASPPASPTRFEPESEPVKSLDKCELQCKVLKPSTVEVINRQNILASAKCRSGKDKMGSPEFKRKNEEAAKKELYTKRIPTSKQSVGDLKKAFEKVSKASETAPKVTPKTSITRTVKEVVANTESRIQKRNSLDENSPKLQATPKASFKALKENFQSKSNKFLTLSTEGGKNLGIILTGGSDCENKQISVHRIRYGSVAFEDGRLKRGVKIFSINGVSTKNMTHDETVELLKQPVNEFVFEVDQLESSPPATPTKKKCSITPLISEGNNEKKQPNEFIFLNKEGGNLGFSIQGGKDSPEGDVPLTIKKVFPGGLAEKHGALKPGDELLAINDIRFDGKTRIEVWNLMKQVPDGSVTLHIFRKLEK